MLASVLRTAVAAAAVGGALAAGSAIGQGQSSPDSTFAVGPRMIIRAPQPSPIDFPGVRGDAPGKPLAAGSVVIGYRVSITRGETTAYPTFTMTCPSGTTLRTFGTSGNVSPQIVGFTPFVRRRAFEYPGQRRWGVVVDYSRRLVKVGQTATGTVYALCR